MSKKYQVNIFNSNGLYTIMFATLKEAVNFAKDKHEQLLKTGIQNRIQVALKVSESIYTVFEEY